MLDRKFLAMTRLAIDLPDEDARWAAGRVAAGEAPSVAAYFAELARRDRERTEEFAALQAAIDKGEASGLSDRSIDEIFDEVLARYVD